MLAAVVVVLSVALWAAHVDALDRPLCAPDAIACEDRSINDQFKYRIHNETVEVAFREGQHFAVECSSSGALRLDDPALPAFNRTVRVERAHFIACALPAGDLTYAAVLLAFNVSVTNLRKLEVTEPPARPALPAPALARLPRLLELVLVGTEHQPLHLHPAALAPLQALRSITLTFVADAGGAAEPVLVAALGLPALERLIVRSDTLSALPPLPAASVLRWLTVTDAPLVRVPVLPQLERVTFTALRVPTPARLTEPWGPSVNLTTMTVTLGSVAELPAGWVAGCPRLRQLTLSFLPRLRALPPRLLSGATALRSLEARNCNLTTLPADLLDDAADLRSLDLSLNRIEALPDGMFSGAQRLEEVVLSYNRLAWVGSSLPTLPALRVLRLDFNPLLADTLCKPTLPDILAPEPSALSKLTSLVKLSVRGIGLKRVCRDWRLDMRRLAELDLRNNSITLLQAEDLKYLRDESLAKAQVALSGVLEVVFLETDYERALGEDEALYDRRVQVQAGVQCDCRVYWAARLANHLNASALHCNDSANTSLARVKLDSLRCAVSAAECARNCTCEARAREPAGGIGIDMRCAGLTAPPPLPPASAPLLALRLADNNIADLRDATLPDTLQMLDLTGNNVSRMDEATAERVFAGERRVRLARNPLHCACDDRVLLDAIVRHRAQLDYANLTCRDGRNLSSAARAPCGRVAPPAAAVSPALLAALGGVALAALAAAAFCARRLPAPLKRLLRRLGLRAAPPAPSPSAVATPLLYDCFLSFAHEDEAVARELTRRLESEEEGEGAGGAYRVCRHDRDWVPGALIPAQIAASVRVAARTVALVSPAYLASRWARAEFREAHALSLTTPEPRLVLVLLSDAARLARLAADPELRSYLQNNTYVCRDDPHFWRKLRAALPHAVTAAAAAAAAAPTVPTVPAVAPLATVEAVKEGAWRAEGEEAGSRLSRVCRRALELTGALKAPRDLAPAPAPALHM